MAGNVSVTTGQSPRALLPRDATAARSVDSVNVRRAVTDRIAGAGSESAASDIHRADAVEELAPVSEVELRQIVDQANSVTETLMSRRDRSIVFGLDEASGRLVMTITEKRNGETVERQIPPDVVLKVIEHLSAIRHGEEDSAGSIVDMNV